MKNYKPTHVQKMRQGRNVKLAVRGLLPASTRPRSTRKAGR